MLKHLNVNLRFIEKTFKRCKKTCQVQFKNKPRIKRTVRTMNVARTMRVIVENDWKLKPYKKQIVHGLTAAQKAARVQKCPLILAWHAGDRIIFSDEKLFCCNRVYSISFAFNKTLCHLNKASRTQEWSTENVSDYLTPALSRISTHWLILRVDTCCTENYLSLIYRKINDFLHSIILYHKSVDFTILVINFTILNY
jgi:hypothetical protein